MWLVLGGARGICRSRGSLRSELVVLGERGGGGCFVYSLFDPRGFILFIMLVWRLCVTNVLAQEGSQVVVWFCKPRSSGYLRPTETEGTNRRPWTT